LGGDQGAQSGWIGGVSLTVGAQDEEQHKGDLSYQPNDNSSIQRDRGTPIE
jgi:hypothetical protein